MKPLYVRVHPQPKMRRWRFFPVRTNYWALEIIGYGWTQSYCNPADLDRMVRDYMTCTYDTDPSIYDIKVEYLTPVMGDDNYAMCGYCNQTYHLKREGGQHFIPCNTCDSLEHATCQH